MKKITVIHIITRFDKGGSAENTFLTVRGLDKNKYRVILIKGSSLESNMDEKEMTAVNLNLETLKKNDVAIINLPSLVRRIDPVNDIKTLFNLFGILKRERPDIVHTHTSKAGFIGRWAAFLARVPFIVYTPHGHVFHSYFGFMMTKAFVIAEKISSLITDTIITLTDRERDEHIKERIAPKKKFVTIPSGVELERFTKIDIDVEAKKRELNIANDFFIIGTIGRLVPIKGHTYLISAVKKIVEEFPKTTLLFIGDGHLKSELEEQAKRLGVRDSVVFAGWRNDIPEILKLFDILVFPSLNEGMGKVVIEGMAQGKPIIASNVGGIRDLIKDGVSGILVPPKDVEAIETSLLLLMKNRALAEELGKKGKTIVYPVFDASTMVKKIENLYDSLLARAH